MNKIFKIASLAIAVGSLTGLTSCDYLDVVPAEQPGLKDAMKTTTNAEAFLYSCYKGVSQRDFSPRDYRSPLNCANDEYLIPEVWMAVDGPSSYAVMRNTLQTTPTSYDPGFWNAYYDAIGQTLLFDRELDSEGRKNDVWKGDENKYNLWKAESKFCRAVYHYQVLRLFGPCPITETFIDTQAATSTYPGRRPFGEVVDWIVEQLDQVATELDNQGLARREVEHTGRASATIAKCIKSRLLLMAASNLWNGNFSYPAWRGKGGQQIVPTPNEAQQKATWERALIACQEALDYAESKGGYALYTVEDADKMDEKDVISDDIYIPDTKANDFAEWLKKQTINGQPGSMEAFKSTVRMFRYLATTTPNEGNNELIWINNQVPYGTQDARFPRRILQAQSNNVWKEGWNGVSPTLYTVEHFLTADGNIPAAGTLCGSKTEWYKTLGVNVNVGDKYEDQDMKAREHILNVCTFREPRFYAWIAFDGGDYLTRLHNGQPKVLNMRSADQQGRGQGERNYSVTGFLSMKHVDPLSKYDLANGAFTSGKNSPDVLFRLAECYLNLAECFAEYAVRGWDVPADIDMPDGANNALEAALYYVNVLRDRAYVGRLTKEMCNGSVTDDNTSGSKKMDIREWVRNERFVELWDEGQRYHDVRRWAAGEEYFSYGKRMGLNGLAIDPKDAFTTPMMINSQYIFHKRLYLWPLYQSEVYNNPNMVQAPGY